MCISRLHVPEPIYGPAVIMLSDNEKYRNEAKPAAFAYFLPYGRQLGGWLTRREAGTPEATVQMFRLSPPDQKHDFACRR